MDVSQKVKISIFVTRLERSLAFYRDALGFELARRGENHVICTLEEQSVVLCNQWWPEQKFRTALKYPLGRGCQFTFQVSDIASLDKRLKKEGIDLFVPRWTHVANEPGIEWDTINVLDPDGYVLTFEEKRTRPAL